MEIRKEDNGKAIIYNDVEKFTFVDMEDYVVNQFREWYEDAQSVGD